MIVGSQEPALTHLLRMSRYIQFMDRTRSGRVLNTELYNDSIAADDENGQLTED